MSYATAAALQSALYARLAGDAAVGALVGGAIHDALPPGEVPALYVTLGPEEVRDIGARDTALARFRLIVSVHSAGGGFQAAKEVAAAISDALAGPPPQLGRGRLLHLGLAQAKALRVGTGAGRRIELSYDALVEDDQAPFLTNGDTP